MKCIEALQLPEVLNGSMWVVYKRFENVGLCQTFQYLDGRFCWADNFSRIEFSWERLQEEVKLVKPYGKIEIHNYRRIRPHQVAR